MYHQWKECETDDRILIMPPTYYGISSHWYHKVPKYISLTAFQSIYLAYILINLLFICVSFLFIFLLRKKMKIKKNPSRICFPWTPNSCLSCMTTHWFLIKVPFCILSLKKKKEKENYFKMYCQFKSILFILFYVIFIQKCYLMYWIEITMADTRM